MIVDVVQKPITYRAMMYKGTSAHHDHEYWELTTLLHGTGVKATKDGGTRLEWPAPADCMYGVSKLVWGMDWIVVSSLGEVRIMRPEDYEKEFAQA